MRVTAAAERHGDDRSGDHTQRSDRDPLPANQHGDRRDADRRREVVRRAIHRHDPEPQGLRDRDQVGDPFVVALGQPRLCRVVVVDHHVELTGEDQHTDATEHPLDHGRRDGAEVVSESEHAGGELDQARA